MRRLLLTLNATILVSLSLWALPKACTAVRRKRRYSQVLNGEATTNNDERLLQKLVSQNYDEFETTYITRQSRRKVKGLKRGGFKRDTDSYVFDTDENNQFGGNTVQTLQQQQVATVLPNEDLLAMTNEELERYFFELQSSQLASYPPVDEIETKLPSTSVVTKVPTLPAATKTPTPVSSPPPTPKATPSPVTQKPVLTTPAPTFGDNEIGLPTYLGGCSSVSRRDALVLRLSGVSDDDLLLNPQSPQGQAYAWMSVDDPAQVDPCSDANVEQRYVLATLYYSTNGGQWEFSDKWLSGDSECKWYGVMCDGGNVTNLELAHNLLSGPFPSELAALENLETMDLMGNSLTGTLPVLASSMKYLDVENNELKGSPFDGIPEMPNLKGFHVSSNAFTGKIPTSLPLGLEELWMSDNKISGAIPSQIGELSNLQTLFIYNNNVGGTIPPELGNLDLVEFLANNNTLEGPIPEAFWNNERLTLLRLDDNRLSGTISRLLGNLVNLADFFLSNNTLQGSLPVTLFRLTNLVNLLLNNNQLTGTIRDGFGSFNQLDFVDLSENSFTGTLPASLFDIRNIRFIYFSNNTLDGPIPSNYGNGAFLKDLYLDGNQLSGTIPAISTGGFARLTELLLNDNKLTGSMPGSICDLRDNAILEDLWADCAGSPPEIECAVPSCCTFCYS